MAHQRGEKGSPRHWTAWLAILARFFYDFYYFFYVIFSCVCLGYGKYIPKKFEILDSLVSLQKSYIYIYIYLLTGYQISNHPHYNKK